MKAQVRCLCLCWLVLSATQLQAGSPADYQSLIRQESLRSGVPANLIQAVIRIESSFRETIVSPKGAQGLMQLMPATARRMGVKNAFDPKQNIRGGTQYLAWLYRRYQNWSLALAAYNAGEGKVDKYGGIPPYRETRNYVRKVLARYAKLTGQSAKTITPTSQPLLFPVEGRVVQAVMRGDGVASAPVFSTPIPQALEKAARGSSVFFAE